MIIGRKLANFANDLHLEEKYGKNSIAERKKK
jgi:hypothetical protein